jgi:uncharacterized membrane protein
MSTIYDYLTMAMFAGLIVLFLQRSVADEPPQDYLWQYLVAAVGCAVADYLGNEGYGLPAVLVIVAVLAFTLYVLRPFPNFPPR